MYLHESMFQDNRSLSDGNMVCSSSAMVSLFACPESSLSSYLTTPFPSKSATNRRIRSSERTKHDDNKGMISSALKLSNAEFQRNNHLQYSSPNCRLRSISAQRLPSTSLHCSINAKPLPELYRTSMAGFIREGVARVAQYLNPADEQSDHGGPSRAAGRDRLPRRAKRQPAPETAVPVDRPYKLYRVQERPERGYMIIPGTDFRKKISARAIVDAGGLVQAADKIWFKMREALDKGSSIPGAPLTSATRPRVSGTTARAASITTPRRAQTSRSTPTTAGRRPSAVRMIVADAEETTTVPQAAAEKQPKGPEPPYVTHDAEIRDEIWLLMNSIQVLAKKWFKTETGITNFETAFKKMCNQAPPQFVSFVGRIAAGGPNKEEGWKELFRDDLNRQALVNGLIGNTLVEQVFAHTLFGVDDEKERRIIDDIQDTHKHSDGFARTELYAEAIRKLLPERGELPGNFYEHAVHISLQMFLLIQPILRFAGYSILGKGATLQDHELELISELFRIVVHAGLLSITMRLDGSAVYYWVPTLKDDRYDDATMECFNRDDMMRLNPKSPTRQKDITDSDERNRATGDEGLVRVNCMSGCTVYRRGGWEERVNDNYKVDDQRAWKVPENNASKGMRSRQLTQNWVLCRWGRQRKWTNGVKSDVALAHGYKDGSTTKPKEAFGFMEFIEVVSKYKTTVVVASGSGSRR
ncbi:hypothetical protein BU16DRAFT_60824 [Lophium mytilinum]|uniref:Uncharacterized protein n=1 Tax=Lophium mytilinum TaxID=390894 RepID=A0A6A6QPP5_9PEZI|nr:hypothetical protein BU16DRAFT_60824 [Lophium mytilinum]